MRFYGTSRAFVVGACAAILIVQSPDAAHAQNWLGSMIGQMEADQAAAEQEKACRQGAPADPDDVRRASTRIESTMTAYFSLTPKSQAGDIRKLFTSDEGVHWRDASGDVAIADLAPHLGATAPQRTLIAMVVGGDNESARAIWSTTAMPDAPARFYAADFVNKGWLGGWEIWHLSVFPASSPPDVPAAFCHFDPDQSF